MFLVAKARTRVYGCGLGAKADKERLMFALITVQCQNKYRIICIISGVKTGTQNFSSQTLSLSPVNPCFNNNRKHLGSCLCDSRKSWNGQSKCQSSLSFSVQNYKLSERPSALICVSWEEKREQRWICFIVESGVFVSFLPNINWDLAECDTA